MLDQRIVSTLTRPTRFAFIVNRDISKENLRLLFQSNTLLWGGLYNLFVPTDGEHIDEYWKYYLKHYDPDIVVLVGDIGDDLADRLATMIGPIAVIPWSEEWLRQLLNGMHPCGISMVGVFRHHYDQEGLLAIEDSNCRYPQIGNGKYQLFYEMLYGSYPDGYRLDNKMHLKEIFLKYLGASLVDCNPQNIVEHLKITDDMRKRLSPAIFTNRYLKVNLYWSSSSFMSYPKSYSIFISDGSIDDLFSFHAMRWSNNNAAIFIFPDDIKSDDDIQALVDFVISVSSNRRIGIAGPSLSFDYLKEFAEKIKPHLPARGQDWLIDITNCNIGINITELWHIEKKQQIVVVQDRQFSITPVVCEFKEKLTYGKLVVELEFLSGLSNRLGFKPSLFSDLNTLLSGVNKNRLFYISHRMARGNIAACVDKSKQVIHFFIPDDNTLLTSAIENAGFTISHQENKGRFYINMIALVGEIEDMLFLQKEYMLRLFKAISDKRVKKAYTFVDLEKIAKPGTKNKNFFEVYIQELAGKEVFIRGYNFKCDKCDLNTWYQVDELAEWIVCKGCRNQFQVPVKGQEFAYQLNQLFIEGLSQGGATVILTVLVLHRMSRFSLIWSSGYKLKKNGKEIDIDLIVMSDGMLLLAECKDNFEKDKPEKVEEVILQLKKNIVIANELNADFFFFAVLMSLADIPGEIKSFIADQNARNQHMTIGIISRDELLKGHLIDTESESNQAPYFLSQLLKPPQGLDQECLESINYQGQ